jgi:hypothetical protein
VLTGTLAIDTGTILPAVLPVASVAKPEKNA